MIVNFVRDYAIAQSGTCPVACNADGIDGISDGDSHGARFDIAIDGGGGRKIAYIDPGSGGGNGLLGESTNHLPGVVRASALISSDPEYEDVLCATNFALHIDVII